MKPSIVFFLLAFHFFLLPQSWAQKTVVPPPSVPKNFTIAEEEMRLYDLINQYRAEFNLPPIPLSRSLSYVAHTHVKDLIQNKPDQPPCNFHSWSNRGNWKPFCYPGDEKKGNSVWDKPKELTGYKGKAFEIIYWENNPVTIDSIIPFWSSIDYFNSFLLNTGKWQDKKWMAIGIGIYENYAAAWFGEVTDVEDKEVVIEKPVEPVIVEKEKVTPAPKPEITVPTPPVSEVTKEEMPEKSGMYYIIVSSQQPRAKSNQLAEQLKKKGYPDAKVLAKDNKVRVSVMELSDKAKADSALRVLKPLFKGAWILKW